MTTSHFSLLVGKQALIIASATCSAICQIAPSQVTNLPYTRPKR
jgi:hypothetical protein